MEDFNENDMIDINLLFAKLRSTQIKVDSLEDSVKEILTCVQNVKNESAGLAKSVSNIISVGETIQRLSDQKNSPKIVVNSIEYKTLMGEIEEIINKRISDNMEKISEMNIETMSNIQNAIEATNEVSKNFIKASEKFTSDVKEHKTMLVEKIKELADTKHSLSYLTNFTQDLLLELRMIYPKIDEKNSLYINYIVNAPETSRAVIREVKEVEAGKAKAKEMQQKAGNAKVGKAKAKEMQQKAGNAKVSNTNKTNTMFSRIWSSIKVEKRKSNEKK